MKTGIKHIISCLILLSLLALSLSALSSRTERKYSREKDADFFSEKGNFDVLFLGSSHMINGVYPLDLWNEYGIVSYNLGCHNATVPVSSWILRNALLKTKPKLVVLDGYMLSHQEKIKDRGLVHEGLDDFPLTPTKVQAVHDLLSDEVTGTTGSFKEMLPYLWDFVLYHERWSELSSEDVVLNRNTAKGAERRSGLLRAGLGEKDDMALFDGDSTGIQYIRQVISDCRENGIEILLVYLPCTRDANVLAEANRLSRIAEEEQVNCINFLSMDVVDSTGFCDYVHLNPYGAKLVTRYLGDYMTQHYDLPDHRGDEIYYDWYDAYDACLAEEAQELKNCDKLGEYMTLLAAENYDVILEVSDPKMWDNRLFRKLLRQMGADPDSINEHTDLIALSDGGWDMTAYDYFDDQQRLESVPFDSVLGGISKEWTDTDISLRLNGETLYTIGRRSTETVCPVRITVMDRTTKQVIDSVSFRAETDYDVNGITTTGVYR